MLRFTFRGAAQRRASPCGHGMPCRLFDPILMSVAYMGIEPCRRLDSRRRGVDRHDSRALAPSASTPRRPPMGPTERVRRRHILGRS